MCCRQETVCVLNTVKIHDQQIRAARRIPEQIAHILPGVVLQLAPLGVATPFAFAGLSDALLGAIARCLVVLIQRHDDSLLRT